MYAIQRFHCIKNIWCHFQLFAHEEGASVQCSGASSVWFSLYIILLFSFTAILLFLSNIRRNFWFQKIFLQNNSLNNKCCKNMFQNVAEQFFLQIIPGISSLVASNMQLNETNLTLLHVPDNKNHSQKCYKTIT